MYTHTYVYRECFYCVDWVHGDRCAARHEAHANFADESVCLMADNARNEGKFLLLFTDHRRCWKCCPIRVDIPLTGRRGSDLTFEAVVQEILQFSYENFLLILPFGAYFYKLYPSNNPRRKRSQGVRWTCWPNTTVDNSIPEENRTKPACSVGSSWVLLKPAIESFFLC
jgi:hypothetical protein